MDLEKLLTEVLAEMKYQSRLLETLVSNQKVGNNSNQAEVLFKALSPILDSGLLPDGHPAKELLKNSMDQLKRSV